MKNLAFRAKTYLEYRKRAVNQYGLHSPFLFELYNTCFKPRFSHQFPLIDKVRNDLKTNNNLLEIKDYGAGSLVSNSQRKQVSAMYKSASISKKQGELFNRLVKYFNPSSVVELGTHLGLSGWYFLDGTSTHLHTLEGCSQTQALAKEVLSPFQGRIHFYLGSFEENLGPALDEIQKVEFAYIDGNHTYKGTIWNYEMLKEKSDENTVLIFDDINWSPGMKKAWDEIISKPEVSISLNCYKFGIIFFKLGIRKQDFYLKF